MTTECPNDVAIVTCIDTHLLREVVSFLAPFHDATQELEGQHTSNISFVIPIMDNLKEHCASNKRGELVVMAALKRSCSQLINQKFKISLDHTVKK